MMLKNSKMRCAVRATVISGIAALAIILPYLPGEYDNLAVAVSAVTQTTALGSALFVPLGIAWLSSDLLSRKKGIAPRQKPFWIVAAVILSLCFFAGIYTAIGGMGNFRGSLVLAILLLAAYLFILFTEVAPRIKRVGETNSKKAGAPAVYLILIPVAVLTLRFALVPPLAENCKNTAIEHAQALIGDLEAYYEESGQYPVSLEGLWSDYKTGAMGIEKYHYERSGKAYNVFFEILPPDMTAREIVMYNKRDEHIIRSHPSFLFSMTQAEFAGYRGYFAENAMPQEHWKSYLFD